MPKISYIDKDFHKKSIDLISIANRIIEEYASQGFDLTLRQLYYQMVSRDIIPNNQKEYKKLGNIINNARLAGLIDWDHIVDRTRNLKGNSHWAEPASVIRSAAHSYQIDKWATQQYRVEVWIEKDALVGVIASICERLDIPYFSCRGYTSQSEMWTAAQRLKQWMNSGQTPIILHLGDHDPSGIDMTRDIIDRIELFIGSGTVNRLALNHDQVEQYSPPPNPAKLTDTRATAYIAEYGRSSWELDALEPSVIATLIEDAIMQFRDPDAWGRAIEAEKIDQDLLWATVDRWGEITEYLQS